MTDNCDIVDDVPESALLTGPYCRQEENFLTDGKLVWTYAIPKIDVNVSGLFISRPGPAISANRVVPNAEIVPSLGRSLSNNAPNATVNMVHPGTLFGDRRNQLDLRFTKPIPLRRDASRREFRTLQRVQHQRGADRERDLHATRASRDGAFPPASCRRGS